MTDALRNISRRKLRTILTVAGIVIGVYALTVMGALAEKLNVLVDGGQVFFEGRIFVSASGEGGSGDAAPLNRAVAEEIEQVDGVDRASPVVQMLLDPEVRGGFDFPPLVSGIETETWYDASVDLPLASGRLLAAGDDHQAMIGADLGERYGVRVGDTLPIRGEDFEVIGILERTLTFPDKIAYVPLANAQALFVAAVPDIVHFETDEIATQIQVFPIDAADIEVVADRIQADVDGINAVSPAELADQLGSFSIVFNLIILGASVIAVVVGGLSVINTMVMTVSERVREIGIKKAVGAPTGAILREFLAEATVLGALGGLIGLALGALTVTVLNAQTADSGTTVFLITPMLLLRSFAFATILGMLAGIYPAYRAARLDPVQALRNQ